MKFKEKRMNNQARLSNGDFFDHIGAIPDGSVDLVITDPPYRNISGGNKSKKWKSGWATSVLHKNDGKIFNHNSISFEQWIPEIYRVLKDGSHFYCMTNVLNIKKLIEVGEKAGFYLHNILVWEKNTANANRWYMKNCEFVCFFKKGKAKTINNPSSKMIHKFDNPRNKTHPTEKPVGLMEFYILNSTKKGEIVFDPFMGTGSSGVASIRNDRNFVGFEIEKSYFDIAMERIGNAIKENIRMASK